jgi:hypothetical protein
MFLGNLPLELCYDIIDLIEDYNLNKFIRYIIEVKDFSIIYYLATKIKDNNEYLIYYAIQNGHLDVIKYLNEVCHCNLKRYSLFAIIYAALNGHF